MFDVMQKTVKIKHLCWDNETHTGVETSTDAPVSFKYLVLPLNHLQGWVLTVITLLILAYYLFSLPDPDGSDHHWIFSRAVPACWVSSIGGWWSPGRAPAPGCRCVWRRSGWDPDPLRWRAAALAECCLPALSPQPERRRKRKKGVCHWLFDWLTPSMNY